MHTVNANEQGLLLGDADGIIRAQSFGGRVGFPVMRGVWTPGITFATPGDLSVTYSTQLGDYIKSGDQVTIWGRIVTSAFTYTTSAGNFEITGVPFPSSAIAITRYGSAVVNNLTFTAGKSQVNVGINASASVLILTQTGSGATITVTGTASFPTGTAISIYLTLTYLV